MAPSLVVKEIRPAFEKAGASGDQRRYELSDLDATITPITVFNYLFYRINGTVNENSIRMYLMEGLSLALARLPIFAGRVHAPDGPTGRPYVLCGADQTVQLSFNSIVESQYSIDALAETSFNLDRLDCERLLPPSARASTEPAKHHSEVAPAVWHSQLNFVPGGIIFALGFHHFAADAWACHRFITLFAEYTRRLLRDNNHGDDDLGELLDVEVDMDRTLLQSSDSLSGVNLDKIEDTYVREFAPTLRQLSADQRTAMAQAITPGDQVVGLLLHIPKSALIRLKNECKPPAPAFVSTYDCLCALIWRSLTTARLQAGYITADDLTGCSHNVNQRGPSTGVSEAYIGNASAKAVTDAMSVSDLVNSGNGLRIAAIASRKAIQKSTVEKMRLSVDIYQTLGKPRVKSLSRAFSKTGLVATSWQQMAAFDSYDFGFGLPIAFRSPGVPLDGGLVVFPTPKVQGITLWIGSAAKCIGLMRDDEELLRYAALTDNTTGKTE